MHNHIDLSQDFRRRTLETALQPGTLPDYAQRLEIERALCARSRSAGPPAVAVSMPPATAWATLSWTSLPIFPTTRRGRALNYGAVMIMSDASFSAYMSSREDSIVVAMRDAILATVPGYAALEARGGIDLFDELREALRLVVEASAKGK